MEYGIVDQVLTSRKDVRSLSDPTPTAPAPDRTRRGARSHAPVAEQLAADTAGASAAVIARSLRRRGSRSDGGAWHDR